MRARRGKMEVEEALIANRCRVGARAELQSHTNKEGRALGSEHSNSNSRSRNSTSEQQQQQEKQRKGL